MAPAPAPVEGGAVAPADGEGEGQRRRQEQIPGESHDPPFAGPGRGDRTGAAAGHPRLPEGYAISR